MMMRDKASGRVFLSEKEAVEWFCHGRNGCEGCPMDAVSPARMCRHDAWEQPFEAARAMGMEVVRYRLTDAERQGMQAFGARWVSRTVEDEDAEVPDAAEMWVEEPHLVFGSVFVAGPIGANLDRGRVARCLPRFFASLAPGDCIGVDDLVVVEEDDS